MTLEQAAKELEMSLEEALDRVVNKKELLIRLLKVYVTGEYMEQAKQALEKEDYTAVETNVHTMKGSGASLGLMHMADACHQVVAAIRAGEYAEVAGLFVQAEELYKKTQEVIMQIEA